MVKDDSMYSISWIMVKYTPSMIVKISLSKLCVILLFISLWWDHVIVSPEVTRIMVLSNGISNGLKGMIPVGGQD